MYEPVKLTYREAWDALTAASMRLDDLRRLKGRTQWLLGNDILDDSISSMAHLVAVLRKGLDMMVEEVEQLDADDIAVQAHFASIVSETELRMLHGDR